MAKKKYARKVGAERKRAEGAGRPVKKIDVKMLKKLASIQCSYAEMSAMLGCDVSTLQRNFAQVIKDGRKNGTCSLKRLQYKAAEKGSNAMLIWLGKQYLGQTEKSEVKQETKADVIFSAFNVEFGDGTPNDT